jgi:DNA polymerase-3 subunit delta'
MHAATPEAANCLLKTLEEPPSRVVLILTATDVAALPETVVSRCQVTALRRVAEEAIARLLERRHGLTSEHALQLARLSDGRPRWAVMVAEQPKVWENRRVALDSLARALRADRVERLQLAAELGSGEDLIQTLLHWQSWWRDLMLLRHGYSDAVINRDRMTELERTAVAAEKVYQTLRAIQLAMDQIRANANSRLATEVLLLRLPALAGPA